MLDTLRGYGAGRLADCGSGPRRPPRWPGTPLAWLNRRPPECGPVPGNCPPRAGWTPRGLALQAGLV